jgi:D-methionine transport system ATP-binding protein
MDILDIIDLTKLFGTGDREVEALRGVNLAIQAGEIFGVIGPSGSGKSTFIRCLNLLEKPTSGQIIYQGRDLVSLSQADLRAMRRDMGLIFQSFNLMSSRTSEDNVAFPLEVAGLPKKQIRSRVAELLELVDLTDKAKAYPVHLSGGQKQRVGIARALANRPKILLSDEATSALDPQSTRSILSLISDVKKQLGLTVILITHEMRVITEICDRVAVLDQGLVVETGLVSEVFAWPRHPVTKSFVQDILGTNPGVISDYEAQGRLVRLGFSGQPSTDSVITDLAKIFSLEVHILKAQVDPLKGALWGTLVLDLVGEAVQFQKALNYLAEKGLLAEVIK